jgi:hypothetical protein
LISSWDSPGANVLENSTFETGGFWGGLPDGVGRVGDDTIQLAYFLAICSMVLLVFAVSLFRKAVPSKRGTVTQITAAAAVAIWLALHLSGTVYSHSSILAHNPSLSQ